jgi:hypothetical protein
MARAKSEFPVKPTILIDTREKPANRLFAANEAGDKEVAAYREEKIDAGDYTVAEIPELVIVEKKQDGKELYTNLILKRDVFIRSLERMRVFKHKYIVIQQTYAEFLDPKNWAFVGYQNRRFQAIAAVESWLISLTQTEQIKFIFAGKKHAPRITKKILLKSYEWERKRRMRKDKELEDAE